MNNKKKKKKKKKPRHNTGMCHRRSFSRNEWRNCTQHIRCFGPVCGLLRPELCCALKHTTDCACHLFLCWWRTKWLHAISNRVLQCSTISQVNIPATSYAKQGNHIKVKGIFSKAYGYSELQMKDGEDGVKQTC